MLEIGYQNRPRLFDLAIHKPPSLAAAVVEIDERVDAEGRVLVEPDEAEIRRQLLALRAAGIESLAICLLHACRARRSRSAGRARGPRAGLRRDQRQQPRRAAGQDRVARRHDRGRRLSEPGAAALRRAAAQRAAGRQLAANHDLGRRAGRGRAIRRQGQHSLGSGRRRGRLFARRGRPPASSGPSASTWEAPAPTSRGSTAATSWNTKPKRLACGVVAPMMAIETVAAGGGSICRFDGVKLVGRARQRRRRPGPGLLRPRRAADRDRRQFPARQDPADRFPFPLDRRAVEARLAETDRSHRGRRRPALRAGRAGRRLRARRQRQHGQGDSLDLGRQGLRPARLRAGGLRRRRRPACLRGRRPSWASARSCTIRTPAC